MPAARWSARGRDLLPDSRPRVMGILNVTPDSFSDGGLAFDRDAAIARGRALIADGADILDIGGESSRPGAEVVPAEEEWRRVGPVIAALAGEFPEVPISSDTAKPEVARRALDAGAWIVNDIGGLRDPDMLRLAAESDCGVVLMHMAGDPRTMQDDPEYGDLVGEIRDYLSRQVDRAIAAGVDRGRIAVDPGIGFGKTHRHNLELLRNTRRFATLGCALLVGASRKGFLGKITGRPAEQRGAASVSASLWAAVEGASILRVHDVAPMSDSIRVWEAVTGWDERP